MIFGAGFHGGALPAVERVVAGGTDLAAVGQKAFHFTKSGRRVAPTEQRQVARSKGAGQLRGRSRSGWWRMASTIAFGNKSRTSAANRSASPGRRTVFPSTRTGTDRPPSGAPPSPGNLHSAQANDVRPCEPSSRTAHAPRAPENPDLCESATNTDSLASSVVVAAVLCGGWKTSVEHPAMAITSAMTQSPLGIARP